MAIPANQDYGVTITFASAAQPQGITVEHIFLEEAISTPFLADLCFTTPSTTIIEPSDYVGTGVSVLLEAYTGNMVITGIVKTFCLISRLPNNTVMYGFTIVPKIEALAREQLNVVYGSDNPLSIMDLIDVKLRRSNVSYRSEVTYSRYPKYDFLAQYNETSLHFLSRHLEKNGVYYYFDSTDSENVIVFGDNNSFPKLNDSVSFEPWRTLDASRTPVVFSFCRQVRTVPEKVFLHDYDPQRPTADMTTYSSVQGGMKGITHSEFGVGFLDPGQDGAFYADVKAGALGCNRETFHGKSNVPNLRAGVIFTLSGTQDVAGEYLVVSTKHSLIIPLPDSVGYHHHKPGIGEPNTSRYYVEFVAIRTSVPFRPHNPALRKPCPPSVFTAIVEAHDCVPSLDEYGRYNVWFHYDTERKPLGKNSHRLRKSDEYAGIAGTGLHFPLLNKTEVLISCLYGNIDRPIIIGTVFNGSLKNIVTDVNPCFNLLRTNSGCIIEINDGCIIENGAMTYCPWIVISVPSSPYDRTPIDPNKPFSGCYMRLGCYAGELLPGIHYTKHRTITTMDPGTEMMSGGVEWPPGVEQIVKNGIRVETIYSVVPKSGIYIVTDRDFMLNVTGGAVICVGKGLHIKITRGDALIAAHDGAIFLGATGGIDLRAGSKSSPANISIVCYGHFVCETAGPTVLNTCDNTTRTVYGPREETVFETVNETTIDDGTEQALCSKESFLLGHSIAVVVGMRVLIFVGAFADITLGAYLELVVGISIEFTLAGFLAIVIGFLLSMKLGAVFHFALGLEATIWLGMLMTVVGGIALIFAVGISKAVGVEPKMKGSPIVLEIGLTGKGKAETLSNENAGVDMKKTNVLYKNSKFVINRQMNAMHFGNIVNVVK